MTERPRPAHRPAPVFLSLGARLACGVAAGVILGVGDGLLLHYLAGAPASPPEAAGWGALLGAGGGVLFVVLERALRGPTAGVALGAVLGVLFGLVPALMILLRGNAGGGKMLAGLVFAPLAAGLILGGLLDRCFEALARPAGQDDGDPPDPHTDPF
jgi:hypothetical protein